MREKKGALEKERGSGQGSDARREGGAGKNRHWKDQEATSCDYKNTNDNTKAICEKEMA